MPVTGSPAVLAIIVSLSGLLVLAVFVIVVFVVRSWKRRRNIEKITSAPGKLTKQQQSEEVWMGSAVEKNKPGEVSSENQDYFDPSYDYMESSYQY